MREELDSYVIVFLSYGFEEEEDKEGIVNKKGKVNKEEIINKIKRYFSRKGMDVIIINNEVLEDSFPSVSLRPSVSHLAENIGDIAWSNVAVFSKDWRHHANCICERAVCEQFKIPVLHEYEIDAELKDAKDN